jgi:hypothetical protein
MKDYKLKQRNLRASHTLGIFISVSKGKIGHPVTGFRSLSHPVPFFFFAGEIKTAPVHNLLQARYRK